MRKPRLPTSGKPPKFAAWLIALIALAALGPALLRTGGRMLTPAPTQLADVAAAADPAQSAEADASARSAAALAQTPEATPLTLEALGADCLPALAQRYPHGRLLKVQINQRSELCNAIIETDIGSGRFFGVQRAYNGAFRQLGEVRLPTSFLAAGALPDGLLRWDELLARDLVALQTELLPADRAGAAVPWAIQRVWMPAPFGQGIWMLGYDFEDQFNWYMDTVDGNEQAAQVVDSMPALAEDLEDPAAYPDSVADRAAGKAATLALEGGPAATGTVAASAGWCAEALAGYATSARVLRVAISPQACSLVLEDSDRGERWRVIQASGSGKVAVLGEVQLPDSFQPLPNYTIDPAWISVQALQERLLRSAITATPVFIGVAWDPASRDVVWLIHPQQLEKSDAAPIRLDRDGQPSTTRFPRLNGDAFGDAEGVSFVVEDTAAR